jgi:organic radical activating enzyme
MGDFSVIAPTVASRDSQQLKPLPAPIARKPGDASPPMVCGQVFDSISIHANGDIVCWCVDVNAKHIYGNVFVDRIADVYNGPKYQEIREWMLQSRPDTWCPAIDSHCSLRVVPAAADQDTRNCRIKHLQIESTTYCNLKCPACAVETSFKQDPHLRKTRGRQMLPLKTMLDVVAQLPDLEIIDYYDYGEPFLHRDTIAFLREVRRTRPGVYIATSTNGTVMTPAQIQAIATEALMDRLVFSIDGATQESYRKYRVGGRFSKAFGKMKALADACRAAGTWRKYVTEPAGRVQITWQYILFEWNDSDEEMALARELARSIDVPIQWVITSGYGASKRFLHGSPEAAGLMDPPDSFIHLATQTEINSRLATIRVACELLSLPYAKDDGVIGYRARFRSDDSAIVAPAGSTVLFNINVENRTDQNWDPGGSDYLRLGVLLKTAAGETIHELQGGSILPVGVSRPGGRDMVQLWVTVPAQPGQYKLILDVVHEWVCWFSERGSPPLLLSLHVE